MKSELDIKIVCFSVFIFLLSASCSLTDSDVDSDSPIITKYLYEGPDGCNKEQCCCTTDVKMVQENAGLESSRWITVKTLKCEDKKVNDSFYHLLIMKLSQPLYNFITWVKLATGNIWAKLTNIYVRGASYLLEMKDEVVSYIVRMSPEIDRLMNNVKKYYQCSGEDDPTVLLGQFENPETEYGDNDELATVENAVDDELFVDE